MPQKTYLDENGLPRVIRQRKSDKPNRKHPLLQDRVRGVWYPDLVGKIRRYPPTQEQFDKVQERGRKLAARMRAEGKFDKRGVPDGWAGRKAEIKEIKEKAAIKAEVIVTELIKLGIMDESEASNSALTSAVEIFERRNDAGEHLHTTRDRLAAIKTVLEFTKSKPVTKTEVSLNPAEAWLMELHKATEA